MGHTDTDETMELQLIFVNGVSVRGCIQITIKFHPPILTMRIQTKYGANTKQQIQGPKFTYI